MQPPGSYGSTSYGSSGPRLEGRVIAAFALLVVTIVLIGISLTLAWWTVSSTNGPSSAWYLGNACSGGSCVTYDGYPSLHDTFGLTSDLVLGSLVLSILALLFLVVSVFRPHWGGLTLLTGFVGSLLLLGAPLYLFAALPGALNAAGDSAVTSFFGSATSSGFFGLGGGTTTWGGGSGWYLALVTFVLFLASTGIAYSATRRLQAVGGVRIATPAYPAPPPPPMTMGAAAGGMFCPACGTHYPAGTQYCSKDATPLKEVTP